MLIVSPGWCFCSADAISEDDVMAWPATEVIWSPAARPAWAAAEPDVTPTMVAPPLAEISTPRKAVVPVCDVDDDVPASIWLAIEDASLIGMANAWVCVCPDWA